MMQLNYEPHNEPFYVDFDDNYEIIDDQVEVGYWNSKIKTQSPFKIWFPLEYIKSEAIKRGKTIGKLVWNEGNERREDEHEVTFEEWISDVDYVREVREFLHTLGAEHLNLRDGLKLEKLERGYGALNEENKELKEDMRKLQEKHLFEILSKEHDKETMRIKDSIIESQQELIAKLIIKLQEFGVDLNIQKAS